MSGTQPTLSAGVVVVRRTPQGWRVLLLRAYRNWDCPKGLVEPGEDPFVAAQREVREEAGLTDLQFPWGDDFSETAPYSRNKVARYYLGQTSTGHIRLAVNPDLGMPEHHEYRWFTFAEARGKVVARIASVLEWAESRIGP